MHRAAALDGQDSRTGKTFSSLRVRNFRLFIIGQALSTTGTWMQLIALPLLVLELTHSGVALGVATALGYLPIMLFGAWGGVFADRFDNRRLLIWTQVAYALTAFALWAVDAGAPPPVWMVYALSFATGLVTAVDMPTRQSFYLDMVGPKDLTNAMSLNTATFTGTRIVGAALGGALATLIGLAPLFLINGVSYLAVVVALLAMRPGELHRRERVGRAKGQIREGVRYVWRTRALRLPMVAMLFVFTFAFNWPVLLPLYALGDLGGNAGTFGALMALFGAGSLVGSLAMAGRSGKPNVRRLALFAIVLAALTALLAATAAPLFAFALMPLLGGIAIAFAITGNSTLQLESSARMRGRVMSLYSVIFLGSAPIGGPIAGWIAQWLGSRAGLAMGAVAAAATGLWLLSRLGEQAGRPPREEAEPVPVSVPGVEAEVAGEP
jgi:MFS family permease